MVLNKPRLTFALTFALIANTGASLPVFASAKTGAICKKLSLTEIVAGKKFTCIRSGKKLVWDKGVTISKTLPSPPSKPTNASTPAQTTNPSTLPENTSYPYLNSPEPFSQCRIPDSRMTKNGAVGAIAYPVTSGIVPNQISTTGEVNVAVIPIDFSDVPGAGSPSTFIEPELAQAKKWIDYFSNGKSGYKFQTSQKWIRASKTSDNYNWQHPGHSGNPLSGSKPSPSRAPAEIASDLMKDAESEFDYRNLNVVFFVYPKNILNIYDAVTMFAPVRTNVGTVNVQINATGAWLYHDNFPMWSWFIHENMHPTGLAGHAPNDGSPFGIMTNQGGASFVLSAWDQIILDWQRDSSIFCVSKENLTEVETGLNAIDNDSNLGLKSIIIKLSHHEVLVIESRRRAEWSRGWLGYPGLPENFAGLLVYKVDTSVDRHRQTGEGGFATFQSMISENNGIYNGPYSLPFDLNQLIKPGQTMKTNGISITLEKSSINDFVRISKN